MDYRYTSTKLKPIEKRLDENRLRLDIWMADCGVDKNNLSDLRLREEKLSTILQGLFQRMDISNQSIFEEVRKIEELAVISIRDLAKQA